MVNTCKQTSEKQYLAENYVNNQQNSVYVCGSSQKPHSHDTRHVNKLTTTLTNLRVMDFLTSCISWNLPLTMTLLSDYNGLITLLFSNSLSEWLILRILDLLMGLAAKAQHIKALTCPGSQVRLGDGLVTQGDEKPDGEGSRARPDKHTGDD